ncbi:m7GpppN-mRNA hydrolase-like [Montipora foliosa]|uniref:m7GpppN-mRNA hydrolase-like n=1 Tax=Montipora foliosa TaxID=591990 RepID=UPI0035F130FF
MASDLELDSIESDSPFFRSSSIIPQTVLEDLCSRFLINIPEEERRDIVRLCFQVETAHWFYVDFYRQEHPELPTCGLKDFTKIIFEQFSFLNKSGENIDEVFENWKKYKYSVPVYGAILLNQNLDKCVLVQPFMSRTSWGFPKGKVNKDESAFDCAIREVLEETGFDMTHFADPEQYLEHNFQDHQVRLYIVPGVPEKTVFQPHTRGEIKNIEWFHIINLPSHKKDPVSRENLGLNPNAFFMVIPFVKGLRKWISTARHRENNHSPEPSLVESSGSKQLKKLLAKEEQRIEQEQKRAAIERRRKQQQEQFQLQHELNHPLRQHHTPQSTKLVKGYQALKEEQGGQRLSPVMREREDKPFYKILQRPQEDSHAVESSNDPLIKLLSGELGHSPLMTHHPFSIPQGVIHPPHAHSQGVNEHSHGLLPARGTPPKKTSSTRSKQRPATPSEHSWEEKEFQFSSSAFLNFKFDPKPILACLPT